VVFTDVMINSANCPISTFRRGLVCLRRNESASGTATAFGPPESGL